RVALGGIGTCKAEELQGEALTNAEPDPVDCAYLGREPEVDEPLARPRLPEGGRHVAGMNGAHARAGDDLEARGPAEAAGELVQDVAQDAGLVRSARASS